MAIHCIKQVPFDDGEDDDEPIVFRRSIASRQRLMASGIKRSIIETPDGSPGRPKSDHGTHNSETSSSQNNKVNKVGKDREMEDLCSICGHQHKHEDGERCSICGHRKPTPSENLEMQNISPQMKLFTALFSYRSPVPQDTTTTDTTTTTTTTTSQIPDNTEDLSMGLYLLQLKKRDQPRN